MANKKIKIEVDSSQPYREVRRTDRVRFIVKFANNKNNSY